MLSNAVKFQEKGVITVLAEVKYEDLLGNQLMLEVQVIDKGIGMSAGELEQIFEPFVKVDSIESKNLNKDGNGVGLSVCKQICESMNGGIKVFSEPGYGSRFIFRMKVFKISSSPDEGNQNLRSDIEERKSRNDIVLPNIERDYRN